MGIFDKVAFAAAGEEEVVAVQPSASEYVEWLPNYMLKKSQTEIRIDSSRPLPGSDEAPGIPDANAVVNKLKVLCGMNPFRLAEPVDGAFERMHSNDKLKFKTRFEDREDRSICTIHLSIRS